VQKTIVIDKHRIEKSAATITMTSERGRAAQFAIILLSAAATIHLPEEVIYSGVYRECQTRSAQKEWIRCSGRQDVINAPKASLISIIQF
jgi:hypothetical protein